MPEIRYSRTVVWVRLTIATILVVTLLVAAGTFRTYYIWCGRLFHPRLARIVSSRPLRHLIPFVPLFVLTFHGYLSITTSIPRVAAVVIWFVAGLIFVEVYSAGLYVRSMQTSDPEIPGPVLWRASWRARRDSDIRLHRLFEVHLIYVVVPCIAAAGVTWNEPAAAILAVLFLVRYLAYSFDLYDFEAVVHWHMHTRSLAVKGKPLVSALVNAAMNYVVGPVNGYVPRLYEIEHMRLHHRYDSGPGDPYSPMPYRRTSVVEFSWFATFVAWANLTGIPLIADRRLSRRWRRIAALHVTGYWLVVIALIALGRPLGFLLPLFALLHGVDQAKSQYKWHGLPDADNLTEPLGNTILWVASETAWRNMLSPSSSVGGVDSDGGAVRDWIYFDNYHLIHHLYPSAHFDRYLDLLRRRAPDIVASQAIVMTLPAISSSVFSMWSGDVEMLAGALLTEPAGGLDKREFLRRRLEPVPHLRVAEGAVFDSEPVRRLDRRLLRLLGALN